MRKAQPVTRLDWHRFYAKRFDRTGIEHAATMAVWYFLLSIALTEE
jgi:hypothetical protein